MGLVELLKWWNLVFVLPFITALGYLFLLASGTVASEHDLDHGIEHDVEHDIGSGHGHDIDHGMNLSLAQRALSFFGAGQMPISILLMSYCFMWGFLGWMGNTIFGAILLFPAVFIWPSLAVAFFGSLLFTKSLARVVRIIMPSTETYVTSNDQLIGKRGEADFIISEKTGLVSLHDDLGNHHQLECRVDYGKDPIPKGAKVLIMHFDQSQNVFIVRKDPLEERGLLNP